MNSIHRTFLVALIFAAACCGNAFKGAAVCAQQLAAYEKLTPLGMERAWFAQVSVDPTRHRIINWTVHNQEVFSLSTGGSVHCLDAETGATRWVAQVGSSPYDATGPAVNNTHVAIMSGSRLFILDRQNGNLLWSRQVGSAPAAAPALSDRYAFVALFDGRIEAYELNDQQSDVWYFQSIGGLFQQPTVTGEVVSWSSDRGYLYIAQVQPPEILFRIETPSEITAPPSEASPHLFIATTDGLVYCVNELTGVERWRKSTGYPISSQPAVVGDRLYVASQQPELIALDAANGELLWRVDGISQFVAQGENYVVGIDRMNTLKFIDQETGRQVGRIALPVGTRGIVNNETDRIFLVHERGTVQALREIGATEPTMYRAPTEVEEPAPVEEVQPYVEEDTPTEAFDDEEDADSPFDTDNPFLN